MMTKRIIACLLALVLMVGMLPTGATHVHAEEANFPFSEEIFDLETDTVVTDGETDIASICEENNVSESLMVQEIITKTDACAANYDTTIVLGEKLVNGKRDFIWPVPYHYNIQSCFFDNKGNRDALHKAIDISAPEGTKIVASYGGTVEAVYFHSTHYKDGSYGNYVIIKHENYIDFKGNKLTLYSKYNHMLSIDDKIKVGQPVTAGQEIGKVGDTGSSQGNHLDFQIFYAADGKKDPWNNVQKYSIDPYSNDLMEPPTYLTSSSVYDSWACGKLYYNAIKEHYAISLCKDHTKSDVYGYCVNCGNWINWTLNTGVAGVYSVIEDFTPRIGGPYDKQTLDSNKKFKAGDKVTVYGQLTNGRGNLWYEIGYGNGTVGYVYNTYLKKYSDSLVVKYNANGGSGAPGDQTKVYDSTLKLSSTKPTRSGYTFLGWATSASATSAKYAAGANYTSNSSITLYAVWQKNAVTYTVTYHPNGGTCSTTSASVQEGKTLTTLPTASMSGYSFAGWYTQPYGGTKITTSTAINSSMTVYAHYTYAYGSKVNLEFDPNGGALPAAVHSAQINGVNIERPAGGLVVYNQSGTTVNTGIYSVEVAVESSGKVIGRRDLYGTTQLVVPEGGFVLSGHVDDDNGAVVGGCHFVWGILNLEDPYVALDYETGTVTYFDSCDGYLAATKMGQEGTRYGALPVPERSGYVFDGWTVNGYPVSYYTGFIGTELVASWSKEDSIDPAEQLVYNGHLYERYDNVVSWTKAKELCEKKGGHLVTITDAAEQTAVSAFAAKGKRGTYKIGATDEGTEGTWRWVTGEKFSYNNWDKQSPEPTNGIGENYASIVAIECAPNKQVGEWIDIKNTDHARVVDYYDLSNTGFICEYDCKHSYTSKVTTAASCEKTGVKTYTCSKCGNSYTEEIAATRHSYTSKVTTAATCTKKGVKTFTCSKCGNSYTEEIAATGHSYTSKVTTAATCTKKGVKTFTCSKCGGSYTEEIAAIGHKYTSEVIPATCTDYEKLRYTCGNCGDVYEELRGTTMSEWSTTKPTGVDESQIETKKEYRSRTKSYTTSTSSSMSGWTKYNTTTQWSDYGSWSSWGDTAVTASDSRQVETRKVYGYYYFKCPKCGAHMHGYGSCYTWAGGCGATTDSSGWNAIWSTMSWDSAGLKDWHGTGKYYTYLNGELVFKWTDGGSKTQYRSRTRTQETIYHYYKWSDWSAWSDTAVSVTSDREVETRTLYRYAVPELGDHSYTKKTTAPTCTAKGYTTYTCSVCGDSYKSDYVNAKGHAEVTVTGKAATCTATGLTDGKKCSTCGTVTVAQTTIKALGHTGGTTTCKNKAVCTRCGNAYGELNKSNHTGGTEVKNAKAATCAEEGYTGDTHCKGCGAKLSSGEAIEKKAHVYTGSVTKEPTATEAGIKTYTCSGCGDSYTEELSPLGGIRKGDINLDGVVDMLDFVALARHIGEVEYITDPVALANAELTGNSEINMEDFVKLAQFIGEVIPEL